MSAASPHFPFSSREAQVEAYRQGAWLFLSSEVMLFGGLFLSYFIGRWTHPTGFSVGSSELDPVLGTLNTALLLTSSYTMAVAVHRGQQGRSRAVSVLLTITALLGLAFIGIKGFEWWSEIARGHVPGRAFLGLGVEQAGVGLFLWFYFTSTALHAVHLSLGVLVMLAFAFWYSRGRPPAVPDYLVILGLYWHLVDLVWIVLFPLLYLVGAPS